MPSQFHTMVFIRSHCLFLWLSPPPLSSFTAVFFSLFSAQIMNHKFYLPLTPQSSFHPCVTFLLWNTPLFEKVFLICPLSCCSERPFCTILHGSGRGEILIPSSAFLGEWMAGRMNDWHSVGNMRATGQGTEWQIRHISRLRVSLQNGQANGLGGKRSRRSCSCANAPSCRSWPPCSDTPALEFSHQSRQLSARVGRQSPATDPCPLWKNWKSQENMIIENSLAYCGKLLKVSFQ